MRPWLIVAALLAIAPQKDAAAAAAGLASADPATRARAACELRALGGQAASALPRLVAMLEDGSPVDAAVCGERTWGHGRFRAAQEMTSPGEQAASALVAIGTPAFDPLAKALTAPVWIARTHAAWALGALGNRRAVPVLSRSLADTEPNVRKRSAWALGALDASEAVPALVEALKDADAGVREQAAWALGAIGDRRAVDGLIGALADSVASVRKQAAWALGALGDSRAVQGLMKALKDSDAGVRKQAAWALGAIGS
ncbi:MAG TPA: HEAT repeat domain-containing protein [Vicinamibacterales bacterium]|nr:HEAT repeat domain-containing protein [Vicinamibacterales bacterium]